MSRGRRLRGVIADLRSGLRGPPEDSTLIVSVPGAQDLVTVCNEALGVTSVSEVPPHITILYPFIRPSRMDDGLETHLGDVFAGCRPFAFSLVGLGHFPGATWLRPTPASNFAALTDAVVRAFPGNPPYRGRFDATIHHLTVAMREPLPAPVEATLQSMLPVAGHAEEVWLMSRPARGRWEVRERFPLGLHRPSNA
ncbi:MAG: 2'-5' RNA ligase family protein [Actinomycetota bacterium]|nr:2'-5' RNA ligase family protein [Actinomycetota bacterium]